MERGEENMLTLKISGMTCNHCVHSVTEALKSVNGVASANVSLAKGIAEVEGNADMQTLIAVVKEEGYQAEFIKEN